MFVASSSAPLGARQGSFVSGRTSWPHQFLRGLALIRAAGIVVAGRGLHRWICNGLRGPAAAWIAALTCFAAVPARAAWTSQDIGTVSPAGQSSQNGSTFTVAGSGADIWDASDAFHFYAQPLSGDGTITARITSMTDTNGWAKAGVMIRESLAANAANVFLAATPTWHGINAQQRSSPAGATALTAGPAANAPYWLRLKRSGTAVTASTSPDGSAWSDVGAFSAPMSSTVYIGLAVTSHNDGTLATATFDNVSVLSQPGESSPPGAPTDLKAVAASSTQVALSWAAADNRQTSFEIERAADSPFARIATTAANTMSYADSGLLPSKRYVYRVRAVNSAGASAYSSQADATTNAPPPGPLGPWQSIDIGTATAGQTSANGDAVALTGSGRDIWNTADGFRYYYQPKQEGDSEMIVRVASLQDTNGWAKAGIMLRQSLDPGSVHFWVSVSAQHGTAFQWRTTTNGETQSAAPSEDGTAPRWLKLVFKAASTDGAESIPASVAAYVSVDGTTWTSAGGNYLTSAGGFGYIGLAVTSHNDGVLCTAQFDHVRLITPPPAPASFQVGHRGPNGEVNLTWSTSETDIDQFVIRTNAQRSGNHDWHHAATVPGTARTAAIYLGGNSDGDEVEIKAYRDFVRSPATKIWAKPTITPGLAVTGSATTSISLRLTESYGYNGGENGPWSVERSSDGVNFVEIASGLTPTGATNAYSVYADYTDSGLATGVTRYYRARELRTNGDSSAYSTVVSATTTASGSTPATPTNLRLTNTSNQVSLTWTDNATNETGYQVERSTDQTTFSLLATVQSDSSTYTDYTVAPSTLYYYRVRAVNGAGASPYTESAFARTWAPPPPAPTGVTATALSTNQIQITWTYNSTPETMFEVERSVDGVNFNDRRFSGFYSSSRSMTDTTVVPATTYYYRVVASNSDRNYSGPSNVAQATTPGTNSPPSSGTWQSADVGAPPTPGSDSASGSTVTVAGGGADIWGASDSFRFRYQTMNGDGAISARVVSMTDTDGWAKAGVMIRSSADANARNVFAYTTPEWHGINAQVRSADGAATSSVAGPVVNAPYWLKLTRAGATFTAQASPNGTTWTTFATFNVTMNTSVVIGLAVTSHNPSALCTATFDNVTLTTGSTPPTGSVPVAPGNLSANPWSSSQVELVWSDNSNNETGFVLERATAAGGPFSPVTTLAANTRRYIDGGLNALTTYWYQLRATNAAGSSTNSNVANASLGSTNGPMAAPTLSASATGPNAIALTWSQGGSGQFTWAAERSTDGVVFQPAFTSAAGTTSATDTSVLPSTLYYYRLRSRDGGGVGPYSNTATATTPASSANWSAADIGAVGSAGSHTASGNTITINGAGADIWDAADAFRFVWRTWNGDGVVEARVNSLANTNGWAKAGVMIRESAAIGARNVFVALTPAWHGAVAQARNTSDAATTQTAGPLVNAPYWVRLARSGNTFTASTSPDGVSWSPFATFNVTMSASANFGFAVTSHESSQLNQAIFEDPYVGVR